MTTSSAPVAWQWWWEVRKQLRDLCLRLGLPLVSSKNSDDLRRCLLSGLFMNTAQHVGEGKYKIVSVGRVCLVTCLRTYIHTYIHLVLPFLLYCTSIQFANWTSYQVFLLNLVLLCMHANGVLLLPSPYSLLAPPSLLSSHLSSVLNPPGGAHSPKFLSLSREAPPPCCTVLRTSTDSKEIHEVRQT